MDASHQRNSSEAEVDWSRRPGVCRRSLDEPITIRSDCGSEDEDDQNDSASHGGRNTDDSRSVDTLPSINTIIASLTKPSWPVDKNDTEHLGSAAECNEPGAPIACGAGREAVVSTSPPAPPLPQAEEASLCPGPSRTQDPPKLPQEFPSMSAAQDVQADDWDDSCVQADSQYPIDPLLECDGSHVSESTAQNGGHLAQDIHMISDEAPQSQIGVANDDHTGHFSCQHIHVGDQPCAVESGKRRQAESVFSHADDPIQHSSRKRQRLSPTRRDNATSTRAIPSPPTSHATSEDRNASICAAKFEEWPLENVILKRVTMDGMMTFQLQFEWPFHVPHSPGKVTKGNAYSAASMKMTGSKAKRVCGTSARFTPQEDDFLVKLRKGQDNISWAETYRRFDDEFPGRSRGSLQVHYCTKLKHREL